MKKTVFSLIVIILMISSCLYLYTTICADENILYVDQLNGNDSNSGKTHEDALLSLDQAISVHNDNSNGLDFSVHKRIILISDYVIETSSEFKEPEHGDIIIEISSENNAKLYFKKDAKYSLGGPTVFKNLNIHNEATASFVANFSSITFDTGLKMTSNVLSKAVKVYGGYYKYAEGLPCDLDSNITIKSGNKFSSIVGFTAQKGSGSVSFTGCSHINIFGGEIDKIYCASLDSHLSNSTEVNLYGGTINNLYTGGVHTRSLRGNANLLLHGGSISKLNLNNVIGDIYLKIDNTILNDIQIIYANSTIQEDAEKSSILVEYTASNNNPTIIEKIRNLALHFNRTITINESTSNSVTETSDYKSTEKIHETVNTAIVEITETNCISTIAENTATIHPDITTQSNIDYIESHENLGYITYLTIQNNNETYNDSVNDQIFVRNDAIHRDITLTVIVTLFVVIMSLTVIVFIIIKKRRH